MCDEGLITSTKPSRLDGLVQGGIIGFGGLAMAGLLFATRRPREMFYNGKQFRVLYEIKSSEYGPSFNSINKFFIDKSQFDKYNSTYIRNHTENNNLIMKAILSNSDIKNAQATLSGEFDESGKIKYVNRVY